MNSQPDPLCEFEARNLILRLKMVVQPDISAIAPTVDRIMEAVREMECARAKYFEIELALREALANAIIHGCKETEDAVVEVCAACDRDRGILIVVRDPGPGFDPTQIPSPVVGQNIFSSGGRGVFLISELMDEVHFKKGGTEIHMVKR